MVFLLTADCMMFHQARGLGMDFAMYLTTVKE
jgi:hypothetical protein